MGRKTGSEPVYQAADGKWYTVATNAPVTVNKAGQIVSRKGPSGPEADAVLQKVRMHIGLGQQATCPACKKIHAYGAKKLDDKWWSMGGYKPFKPLENYMEQVGVYSKKKKGGKK